MDDVKIAAGATLNVIGCAAFCFGAALVLTWLIPLLIRLPPGATGAGLIGVSLVALWGARKLLRNA